MIAYFDCSSGISGDMILGALIDAGAPPQKLKNELSRLPVRGYKLDVKSVKRAGLKATKVDVKITDSPKSRVKSQELRRFKDVEKIIKNSTLSKDIKQKGLSIFKRLFEAEAKVHGIQFDKVHLHELGAIDCIIDIFGTLIGLNILGIRKIYSSALNVGNGTIRTEHGVLPVPAPATIELLRNIPVYSSDILFELTTPTGAVIISFLAQKFMPMPEMKILRIGIGAGYNDLKEQPNVLRLFAGERAKGRAETGDKEKTEDRVMVIETNIDDMNPQIYEYVMEKLFKSGALDVFLTQIIMKKGRPGIKLSALCNEDKKEGLIEIIQEETTSIGLRFYRAERRILHREIKPLDTKFGKVNVKVSRLGKNIYKTTPEYEDCKKIAKKYNIPLLEVLRTIGSSGKNRR